MAYKTFSKYCNKIIIKTEINNMKKSILSTIKFI